MIRIFTGYLPADKKMGGANNFLNALYPALFDDVNFAQVKNIDDTYDVMFLNQLNAGPGNDNLKYNLNLIQKKGKEHKAKIIVRAVNLVSHSMPKTDIFSKLLAGFKDRHILNLVNKADFVVFQSQYQKNFFEMFGYCGDRNKVIYNAAGELFYSKYKKRSLKASRPIRILSSSASKRSSKNHVVIRDFSLLEGVHVMHAGNWPDNVDRGKVEMLGFVTQQELSKALDFTDMFLHPAVKDPCPNSIIEALSMGIPVIYSSEKGSSYELVGRCGLSFDSNNLAHIVTEIRQNYETYIKNIENKRNFYRIERAVEEYKEIFKKVLQ